MYVINWTFYVLLIQLLLDIKEIERKLCSIPRKYGKKAYQIREQIYLKLNDSGPCTYEFYSVAIFMEYHPLSSNVIVATLEMKV